MRFGRQRGLTWTDFNLLPRPNLLEGGPFKRDYIKLYFYDAARQKQQLERLMKMRLGWLI